MKRRLTTSFLLLAIPCLSLGGCETAYVSSGYPRYHSLYYYDTYPYHPSYYSYEFYDPYPLYYPYYGYHNYGYGWGHHHHHHH
jgi:hypothetical protein